MIVGILLAALAILVWGVTFVNTKALLGSFSALEILLLRYGMAYVALWALHPHRGRFKPADDKIFIAMGLTGVAFYQLLENCAIHYTNASNVAILVALCPLATAILIRLFGGENRLKPLFFIGFAVAITGVTLVSMNGIRVLHFRPVGDLLALGAMLCWGFYSVLIAKVNETGYSAVAVIRRSFFWALVAMVPFLLFGLTETGRTVLDGSFAVTADWAVNRARFSSWLNVMNLAFLGVRASAVRFVIWNVACGIVGVVRCSIGLYLIPVVTVLFAYLFLGETLTPLSAFGAVLTLAGVVVSGWRGKAAR